MFSFSDTGQPFIPGPGPGQAMPTESIELQHVGEAGAETPLVGEASADVLDNFELQLVSASFRLMRNVHPCLLMLSLVHGLYRWWTGLLPLGSCLMLQVPMLIVTLALIIIAKSSARPMKTSRFKKFAVALHLFYHVGNLLVRALVYSRSCSYAGCGHSLWSTVTLVCVFNVVGYVPDREFNWFVCPSMCAILAFFFLVHLKLYAFVMGVVVVLMMAFVRKHAKSDKLERFQMARALEDTRSRLEQAMGSLEQAKSSLEQAMSAQQAMLSTFFDASCICNSEGKIVRTTPQMASMLGDIGGGRLLGMELASIAEGREQARLRDFLRVAWASGVGTTTMLQTSLRRASANEDARDGATREARVYCVQLPWPCGAFEQSSLWMSGGMFVGIQEQAREQASWRAEATPSEKSSVVRSEHLREFSMVLDAGTENLQVVRCDPILACSGLVQEKQGILQLCQQDACKQLDDWIYEEVQQAPLGRRSRSRKHLRSLKLKLPPNPGVSLTAKKAWLEFTGKEAFGRAIPVTLKLSGINMELDVGQGADQVRERNQRSQQDVAQHHEFLETIDEGRDSESNESHDSIPTDSERDDLSTLLPDDSASQVSHAQGFYIRPSQPTSH